MGTALGCKVIATASKESKRQICIEKGGADHAIDYSAKDWQKQVMQITEGKGVNVVYDPVVSDRPVNENLGKEIDLTETRTGFDRAQSEMRGLES
jgi:NADPH:quinone reductase-like Zn-dependent oxidoreductase